MESLVMIVSHVFRDHVPEMSLAEEYEVPETLVFDGSNEAFCEGIAVGAPGGNLDAFYTFRTSTVRSLQNRLEVSGEERVSVVNEMGSIAQEPIDGIGQIARHLLHPGAIGIQADASDVDLARS